MARGAAQKVLDFVFKFTDIIWFKIKWRFGGKKNANKNKIVVIGKGAHVKGRWKIR